MRAAFADLRSKYEEMRALREEDLAEADTDPRPRMAALAARFPGALREIDELPLEEITSRIDALARAEHDADAEADWMHAMARFHALARGALFVKRELAFGRERERHAWPDEARAWHEQIEHIASPPRGRLMDLVYERLARELALTPSSARDLVFSSRAARRGLVFSSRRER